MGKLKTWEMIKALTENPKLKFKNTSHIATVDGAGWLRLEFLGGFESSGPSGNLSLARGNDEWKLVQEPVDFMKAITAYATGKTIRCEVLNPKTNDISEYHYIPDGDKFGEIISDEFESGISLREILEGAWYIESYLIYKSPT
jgi:hypothetical protein